jgi:ubiquinone/menaquinone biosynthesis C-methylase UbiE
MNEAEAAERSAGVAALFDRVADTYDNVGVAWFGPIGSALVREVGPVPGQRALDIGCGRGAALFPLAAAVGETGQVTGIDLSPGMLAHAAGEVAARGLPNVDLRVMDASAPDLPPASYDVVVASLVIFFLPDPPAGARAWRRLVAPGGRLGISTFADRDAAWKHLDEIFTPYLPPHLRDARTSGAAGPFATDGGVEGLLTDAGFGSVRTAHVEVAATFTDPEHWRAWTWSHGQRAMWEAVPAGERGEVMAEATRRLAAAAGADGQVTFTQGIRLTVAGD